MNSVDNSDDEDDEEVASQSSKKSRRKGISYTDMPVLYQEPKEEDIRRKAMNFVATIRNGLPEGTKEYKIPNPAK